MKKIKWFFLLLVLSIIIFENCDRQDTKQKVETSETAIDTGIIKKEFRVNGKCEMCKVRIENLSRTVPGVIEANWSLENQLMTVVYNAGKTSLNRIETSLAIAGHDTELFRASDEKYTELPECCHYTRISSSKDGGDETIQGCTGTGILNCCSSNS